MHATTPPARKTSFGEAGSKSVTEFVASMATVFGDLRAAKHQPERACQAFKNGSAILTNARHYAEEHSCTKSLRVIGLAEARLLRVYAP